MDRLRRFVEALRVLAQANDPNRVVLTENAINEYLKDAGARRSLLGNYLRHTHISSASRRG